MLIDFLNIQKPEREFLVRVSYIEIYQENVVDLLADNAKFLSIKEIKVYYDYINVFL